MKRLLFIGLFLLGMPAFAAENQIFIQQTNATNSQIDIEQLGSGNIIADDESDTSTVDAAMNIDGTGLDFNLDQIGDSNQFLTDIVGDDGTYNFSFTGDTNIFTSQFNSEGTYSMDMMDLSSITIGSGNDFTVNIAEGADASDGIIDWEFDGSDNTIVFTAASDYTNSDLADILGSGGQQDAATADSIDIDWDINGDDNDFDVLINSSNVEQDWDITGDSVIIDYAGLNNAENTEGHYSKLNVTGSFWDIKLVQESASAADWVSITATGSGSNNSNATLCVVQNDSGTSVSC